MAMRALRSWTVPDKGEGTDRVTGAARADCLTIRPGLSVEANPTVPALRSPCGRVMHQGNDLEFR